MPLNEVAYTPLLLLKNESFTTQSFVLLSFHQFPFRSTVFFIILYDLPESFDQEKICLD